MWPPTQSIATVPMVESADSSLGIPATRPRPTLCANVDERCARLSPMSSIFTMAATTPYTAAVMTKATTTRMISRGKNAWSATSLRAITMISADRMKSVRIAPGGHLLLGVLADGRGGRGVGVVTGLKRPHTFSAPS